MILNEAHNRLSPVEYHLIELLFDDHYTNFPDAPFNIEDWARLSFMEAILRGSDWHGEIDLTNPQELNNFKMYVSR